MILRVLKAWTYYYVIWQDNARVLHIFIHNKEYFFGNPVHLSPLTYILFVSYKGLIGERGVGCVLD